MRLLASFLLIGFTLTAGATEVWRWKDQNGVVHYSDQPAPGAERVDLGPQRKPGTTPVTAPRAEAPRPQLTQSTAYVQCAIGAPANDEVFNAVNAVNVQVQLEPALGVGHRIRVLLDGRAYAGWPEALSYYTLNDLYRGSHTLSAQVLDADGKSVCSSPIITFHLRQPSVLSPARRPPARP